MKTSAADQTAVHEFDLWVADLRALTGAVFVEIMDPNAVLDLVDKPAITELAHEVRQKLERVLRVV